jgi:MoaA/NifB/PqqE/SkfB family radical SAM enzyme
MFPKPMLYGWGRRWIKVRLWIDIFQITLRCYKNPWRAWRGLSSLSARRKLSRDGRMTFKYVQADGRYFWDLYSPGWPSVAFNHYLEEELNRSLPFRPSQASLQVLLMAITKACPLACEHCFEWDSLNKPESVDSFELQEILTRFLDQGVAQVQFSGGEPLRRFTDLLALIGLARNRADTWIITSGFGLTMEKCRELKQAGLTGILLSLDDWSPERHNRFRGSPQAFFGAEAAAHAAIANGLVLSLSLCATRAFTTPENLEAYAKLARHWGAGFIQIVEPKAVGHYAEKAVSITPVQETLLEKFHLELSYSPSRKDYPATSYQGFAQRREGCGGAARRYLYVDTDGHAHACPFCRESAGNCSSEPLQTIQNKLQEQGCPRYPN